MKKFWEGRCFPKYLTLCEKRVKKESHKNYSNPLKTQTGSESSMYRKYEVFLLWGTYFPKDLTLYKKGVKKETHKNYSNPQKMKTGSESSVYRK